MVQPAPTDTLQNLARLAAKPGVQSTLVLSKIDGSIIKSTGFLATPANSTSSESSSLAGSDLEKRSNRNDSEGYKSSQDSSKSAEHIARMVFQFVAAAKDFAEGMEKGDDARLLRMRTRRQEVVIVPDPKFLLVVIQDVPSA
ncbi:MAG: hypothetical protein L6R40_003021 [Gallowayella cf. fulva]|nr:MAG: hypothetical protein L6R40_003021 [Xanthomendoza cf. fulva]